MQISGVFADPADLVYLQGAWALTRACLRGGGFLAFDERAGVWWPRGDVLGAATTNRDLATRVVLREWMVGERLALHTEGMTKFGRPELVTFVPPEAASAAANVLAQLAGVLSRGRRPATGERYVHGLLHALGLGLALLLGPPPPLPVDSVPDHRVARGQIEAVHRVRRVSNQIQKQLMVLRIDPVEVIERADLVQALDRVGQRQLRLRQGRGLPRVRRVEPLGREGVGRLEEVPEPLLAL